jgi:outer membrane immunogenic protein
MKTNMIDGSSTRVANEGFRSTKALLAQSALALALALSAIPASAADLAVAPVIKKAPERPAPSNRFCDAYMGVQVGYVLDKTTYSGMESTMLDTFLDDGKNDGVTGGLYAGCNFHAGSFVFGIEGDGNLMDVGYGDAWYATIRGRTGVMLDNTLIYATGGAAVGRVDMFSGNYMLEMSRTPYEISTKWGWAFGGGMEHWFTDRVSWKFEYLHIDLGKVGSADMMGGMTPLEAKWKAHILRTGIALHF